MEGIKKPPSGGFFKFGKFRIYRVFLGLAQRKNAGYTNENCLIASNLSVDKGTIQL